jgi:hemin uptake protein HemP
MNALLPHRAQTQHTQSAAAPPPPVHNAVDLTRGGVQARIRLGEQIYTLRITRQGKLILTK